MSTTKTLNPNNSSSEEDKKKGNVIIEFINSLVVALGRFLKSSYLSILIVAIVLILVQALDQANTLLVDMVENDKISLVLCFLVISFFAAVLSHYPLYLYYSKDINDSKDKHLWYAYRLPFKYYIFTYSKVKKKSSSINFKDDYQQDYKAKFFRQALGLVIFSIWHYYIYQAFYPNLLTHHHDLVLIKYLTIVLSLIPLICLIFFLHKLYIYQRDKESAKTETIYNDIEANRKKFVDGGTLALIVGLFVVFLSAILVLILLRFNFQGYWSLQIMTFLVSMLYVLFRVFRVYFRFYRKKYKYIGNNVGFLRFYLIVFLVLLVHLFYSNLAAYFNWWLANAMFILLSCFFIIYYMLACSLKYYFVIDLLKDQKDFLFKSKAKPLVTAKGYLNKSGLFNEENRSKLIDLDDQKGFSERRRRISSILTVLFAIICGISYFSEKRIHELEIYYAGEKEKDIVKMDEFKSKLLENVPENKSMLFVAAHGGGLKANIWTMKVLNEIQKKSNGDFLNRAASLSGASGGMMGLSLYSVLSGKYPGNYKTIGVEIDSVAYENFASRDVAFTFGYDFIRKFVPFNFAGKYRDRSYYAMVRYRNILEDKASKTLSDKSFNTYWKENIYDKNKGYFPSLIVNTAKTNGKRGVFYSVDYKSEGKIFSNSDKLSQLNDGYIAFYEAVSSTNRFPALSPAAKIKGYGHYIDAGAIDNSGLLSSLDLYTYFNEDTRFDNRKKVFVEILNGKSSYIGHLIRMFVKEKQKKHASYNGYIPIEEIEQDNIIADIKTGLNLDKIPNYLSDMLYGWEENGTIEYVPIYLPFHVEIIDVESFIGGEIQNEKLRDEIIKFLEPKNNGLKEDLDDNGSIWCTYEPTLARHLSESTITYYDKVINGKIMSAQINNIINVLK